MAKKTVFKQKKKVAVKNVTNGRLYVTATFNNSLVSLTDSNGAVIAWSSSGAVGFKNARKATPFAAITAVETVVAKGKEMGLSAVEVYIKGPGPGRDAAIRALKNLGLNVLMIADVTPVPHNGPKNEEKEESINLWQDIQVQKEDFPEEGVAVFPKDLKALERKGAVAPGVRGNKVRPRTSEYGAQLREKQKLRRMFGLTERQFRKIFEEAAKKRGATGITFLELLETRLDNIVYTLGFAKSRPEARQMVSHGHITVDSKKVNIPSFRVKLNSVIAISAKFVDNTQVKKNLEEDKSLPGWLERKATVGKLLRLPEREEMEKSVNEQLIVEYYSR